MNSVSLIRRATLALLVAMAANGVRAESQVWPTKPVRLMVPAAAGSAPDVMVRMVAEKLGAMWGKPVVIDNKPGAGGLIALTAVKSGEKDDHGFVFAPAAVFTMTPYMYKSSNVDVIRDFVPVAMVGDGPLMMAVATSSRAETLSDVIDQARKDPEKFVVATTRPYSVPHLAADMIGRAAGISLRAVPFSTSGQSISAVVNGDSQAVIDAIPPIEAMLKSKRLKPVAVFSSKRLPNYPNVPTAAEAYPSLVISGWVGVAALKGTSDAVIQRVNRDIATVLAMPDVVSKFESLGLYPATMTTDKFGTYWAQERQRWETVLRDVGVKPGMQ